MNNCIFHIAHTQIERERNTEQTSTIAPHCVLYREYFIVIRTQWNEKKVKESEFTLARTEETNRAPDTEKVAD